MSAQRELCDWKPKDVLLEFYHDKCIDQAFDNENSVLALQAFLYQHMSKWTKECLSDAKYKRIEDPSQEFDVEYDKRTVAFVFKKSLVSDIFSTLIWVYDMLNAGVFEPHLWIASLSYQKSEMTLTIRNEPWLNPMFEDSKVERYRNLMLDVPAHEITNKELKWAFVDDVTEKMLEKEINEFKDLTAAQVQEIALKNDNNLYINFAIAIMNRMNPTMSEGLQEDYDDAKSQFDKGLNELRSLRYSEHVEHEKRNVEEIIGYTEYTRSELTRFSWIEHQRYAVAKRVLQFEREKKPGSISINAIELFHEFTKYMNSTVLEVDNAIERFESEIGRMTSELQTVYDEVMKKDLPSIYEE